MPASKLHSLSPFSTTQPESQYSFYHLMNGRVSGWLQTEMVCRPQRVTIQVLRGPDV